MHINNSVLQKIKYYPYHLSTNHCEIQEKPAQNIVGDSGKGACEISHSSARVHEWRKKRVNADMAISTWGEKCTNYVLSDTCFEYALHRQDSKRLKCERPVVLHAL